MLLSFFIHKWSIPIGCCPCIKTVIQYSIINSHKDIFIKVFKSNTKSFNVECQLKITNMELNLKNACK